MSLDPAELAHEATASVRPHRVTTWPGTDEAIALVVLTRAEIAAAQIAAAKYLVDEHKLDGVKLALLQPEGLLENEREVQLLARAVRDPSAGLAPLHDVRAMRERLTEDAQAYLIAAYNDFERERSPIRRAKNREELEGMLARLKADGGLSTYLLCCDGDSLRNIALCMAETWSPTSGSSSGTSSSSS